MMRKVTNYSYGFIPFPHIKAEADFIYPSQNLIHQCDSVDDQNIFILVFNKLSRVVDDDDVDTTCSIVPTSLKSVSDLFRGTDKESEVSVQYKSLYHFYSNCFYEILNYLTMVGRYKFRINVDDLKLLFPFTVNISERQVRVVVIQ